MLDRRMNIALRTHHCRITDALVTAEWVKNVVRRWRLKQLGSEHWEKRIQAAEKLGNSGDARTVKPLVNLLKDRNYLVRVEAALSLGKIGDTQAIGPLVATLRDQYRSVREAAAQALGDIGDAQAVESLIATLKDESKDVQKAALSSLGKIGNTQAVEALSAMLRNGDEDVRGAAVSVLDKLGDAPAVESLKSACKDKDEDVQMQSEQRRFFGITRDQIWVTPIIAVIVLTVVLGVRILVGKESIINAEREVTRQDNVQRPVPMRGSTESNLPHGSSPDQSIQRLKPVKNAELESARRDDMQRPTATRTSNEADLSRGSSPDQSTQLLKVEKRALQYTVQVGVFGFHQNAEALADRLKSYGYTSWVSHGPDSEETLYYVFVGKFDARDAADRFGGSLRERSPDIAEYKVKGIE